MWYSYLFEHLEKLGNKEQAEKMSAYMQHQFTFIGIQRPQLSEFIKPYLKESRKYELDWSFINICWEKEYREAQYIGISYLQQNIRNLEKKHLENLKYLITNKSWWETVDSLDSIVGELVLQNPELEATMLEWSTANNLWLRRVSIDYQQEFNQKTNVNLLAKIISNNLGSNEFFINKSIGWSLREYAKFDPNWVMNFVEENRDKMSNLSYKEATKYLLVGDK